MKESDFVLCYKGQESQVELLFLILEIGFSWANLQFPDGEENEKERYRSTYSVISISIRTLDTSCYLLNVLLVDINILAYLTILFWPRIIPNKKKLHYFMELENYKRPWRLKQNFHITDEEMEALKEQIT